MFTRNRLAVQRARFGGFTLFEVIVTLSLIVVLSSIVYVSGNYGFESRALSGASSDAHMMLKGARAQAILSGQDARLIINMDESDPERFLRYIGIVRRDADNPARWLATHSGIYLPEGIYVVPQNTTGVVFGYWDMSVSERKSRHKCSNGVTTMAIANMDFPEIDSVPDNVGAKWMVYQFSPDGHLDSVDAPGCSPGAASVNNQLVLAPGIVNSSGNIEFNDSEKVEGMVMRQNGTSIRIEDPADFF